MARIPGRLLGVCVEKRRLPISEPVDTSCLRRTSTRSVADLTDEIERMLANTGILFDDMVDLAANI